MSTNVLHATTSFFVSQRTMATRRNLFDNFNQTEDDEGYNDPIGPQSDDELNLSMRDRTQTNSRHLEIFLTSTMTIFSDITILALICVLMSNLSPLEVVARSYNICPRNLENMDSNSSGFVIPKTATPSKVSFTSGKRPTSLLVNLEPSAMEHQW